MKRSLFCFLPILVSAGAWAIGDDLPSDVPVIVETSNVGSMPADGPEIPLPVRRQPTVLHWLSTGPDGLNITMDKVKWDSPNSNNGKGTLHVSIGDWTAPAIPDIPIKFVTFDASGNVTGGSYTSSKDHEWKDIFHSGLTIKIGKNTSATVNSTGDPKIAFSGPVKVKLPFNGPEIDAPNSGLICYKSGKVDISFKDAPVNFGVAGFKIDCQKSSLDYHHIPGQGNDTFLFKAIGADLHAPLPKAVTTSDYPLELVADVTIDDVDGKVTVDNTHIKGNDITINLAKPLGFVLKLKTVDLKMTKNVVDKFIVDGEVTLPPSFRNTADIPADPKVDTTVTVAIHVNAQNHGIVGDIDSELRAYWNGFGVHVPAKGAYLDLSDDAADSIEQSLPPDGDTRTSKLPDKWQGLYIKNAEFILPDAIKKSGGNSVALDEATISLRNAYIDEQGFSGLVDANGSLTVALQGFSTELKRVHLKIVGDDIHECAIKGSLGIKQLTGTVDLNVGISHAGVVSVDIGTDNPLTIPNLADFTLESGSIVVDPDKGITKLLMSGVLHLNENLPKVGDMTFAVKDIGVDSEGNFVMKEAWLELPDDSRLDIGPIGLELSEIGFGMDDQKKFWIDLTGGVSIGGDLPLQLQGNFDGLHISQDGTVKIRSIAVDCSWVDIFTLQGELVEGAPKRPKTPPPGMPVDVFDLEDVTPWPNDKDGKPLECISGAIVLGLDCLSGVSVDARFMVAKNSWFAMLGSKFPAPIPFGQSGFGLFGLFGGGGHNVKPDHAGATGIPSVDYQVIPDIDAAEGRTPDNYLFTVGARLGMTAPPPPATPIWGDLAVTLQLPKVNIDVTGNLYLADKMVDEIPANPAKMNRVLHGNINYDVPSSTFRATLGANLNIPDRENWIFGADGALEVLISPTARHAYLGGPIHPGPPVTIDHPFQIRIKNPNDHLKIDPIEGAVTIDFDKDQNPAVKVQAALKGGIAVNLSGTADVGIDVNYKATGNANFVGYLNLNVGNNGDFSNIDGSGTFHVHVDADIEASHHFTIGGTQSMVVKANADANLAASFATKPNAYLKASGNIDIKASFKLGPISFVLPLTESFNQEWKV